ncbi:MAG: GNAT family N-acetyltransferase [Clostridia bacterium]|nr:GNAT family N-acetyltransferase [Clostridia bacterium]
MGTWNTSITGNDTAQDLYIEYSAAFYKFDVEEALKQIDNYIRTEMFDESDEEEWCNYIYSLADFMWKKGILTDSIRNKAIEMIDSGFGLELWQEAGQKTFDSRKKKLTEFKEKLLSPQPSRKKIKPNVHTERIFDDGDIIAVQLQTSGKPYTEQETKLISEEDFHAFDGKYVLMQLVNCYASWTSSIVLEVKDYWACFRLFDGIYDTVPNDVDLLSLKDALIHQGQKISSIFTCESNMFYFKRRNYKVICNRKDLLSGLDTNSNNSIFWGINKPWSNPDSQIVAAMGNQIICKEFSGTTEQVEHICRYANRYGRFDYSLSREENEARYITEEKIIAERINKDISNGGKLYSISFGREIGVVTVNNGHIDNLYIEGQYQRNGFGSRLLEYVLSISGKESYIDVPLSNKELLHICDKLGLVKTKRTEYTVRMEKP